MAIGYQPIPESVEDYINKTIGLKDSGQDLVGGEVAPVPTGRTGDVTALTAPTNQSLIQGTSGYQPGSLLAAARAKKQAGQAPNQQSSPQDTAGKTQEQIMAESGQQSQLDQMRQEPIMSAPIQPTSPVGQPEPQKTVQQQLAETGQQQALDEAGQQGVDVSQELAVQAPAQPSPELSQQESVFGGNVTVTSRAGASGAGYLGTSRENRGTDFAGPEGTPVALPQGQWEVVSSRNDVTRRAPEDFSEAQNQGLGNSVKVRNAETGEIIQMSHFKAGSVPDLKPGQVLPGGTVVGGIGNTGNTHGKTGLHLDVEYYDQQGRRRDVLNSPYGKAFGG